MDGQEYLNQISASVRPEKKSSKMGGSFMQSPIFKVLIIGVAALILIIILGSILSGGGKSTLDKNVSLKLHIDNTIDIISTYRGNLKSSNLRSSSVSLSSILSNTSRELGDYIAEKYPSYKEGKEDKDLIEEATLHKDALDSDLFTAKISGTLDRIFALKMAYEISLITSEEASLSESTRDEQLKDILDTSYNSLDNLYNNFSDFSETK